jgi:hypothetical protein
MVNKVGAVLQCADVDTVIFESTPTTAPSESCSDRNRRLPNLDRKQRRIAGPVASSCKRYKDLQN